MLGRISGEPPLDLLLCVADASHSFIVSGNGDVIEPEHDLMAVGRIAVPGALAQMAAATATRSTSPVRPGGSPRK